MLHIEMMVSLLTRKALKSLYSKEMPDKSGGLMRSAHASAIEQLATIKTLDILGSGSYVFEGNEQHDGGVCLILPIDGAMPAYRAMEKRVRDMLLAEDIGKKIFYVAVKTIPT